MKKSKPETHFSYVDVMGKGFEGSINLFFDDEIIVTVDPWLAAKIRDAIEPKYAPPCHDCGAVVPAAYKREHICDD